LELEKWKLKIVQGFGINGEFLKVDEAPVYANTRLGKYRRLPKAVDR